MVPVMAECLLQRILTAVPVAVLEAGSGDVTLALILKDERFHLLP